MRNEVSASVLLSAFIEGIMSSGTGLVIDGSFYHELGDFVEHHTHEPKSPEQLASEVIVVSGPKLLDFGCGTGGHRGLLESLGYHWTGLNYREGMASDAARIAESMQGQNIHFYDGLHIPFADESFDVIYSFQTFEHIQNIERTFAELYRVLRPGGSLVGAVSYLEQIHDFSTFNFTPFGFKLAVTRAGFKLQKIYPRADVFTFLLRRLLVATSASDDNSLSSQLGADNKIHKSMAEYVADRADIKSANLFRLMFSAHFSFFVTR